MGQRDAEVAAMRAALAQYEAKVRALELSNYSLSLHLRAATEAGRRRARRAELAPPGRVLALKEYMRARCQTWHLHAATGAGRGGLDAHTWRPPGHVQAGQGAFACAAPSLAMGRSILGSRHARAGPLGRVWLLMASSTPARVTRGALQVGSNAGNRSGQQGLAASGTWLGCLSRCKVGCPFVSDCCS